MPFKQRLKFWSIAVGVILFVVFCFMFPPVGGTIIGIGVFVWLIVHRSRQAKAEEEAAKRYTHDD
ncbi:MAG: hypothetical protein F4Y49_03590 [Dehalococcoidia bacterium]|nr:hypothetical protein [Dehalococcoidia bacterium]